MTRNPGIQKLAWAIVGCALIVLAPGCSEKPGPDAPAAGGSETAPTFVPDNKPAPQVRWVERTVAAGTMFRVVSDQAVTADGAREGDPIEVRVEDAVLSDGLVSVPSGSKIQGSVLSSRPGGAGRITLVVAWTRIETPTGANAAIAARTTMVGHPGSILLEANVPFEIALDAPLVIGVRQ